MRDKRLFSARSTAGSGPRYDPMCAAASGCSIAGAAASVRIGQAYSVELGRSQRLRASQRYASKPGDARLAPMIDAIVSYPSPVNEPMLAYAPGSPERAVIKAQIARMSEEVVEIPM